MVIQSAKKKITGVLSEGFCLRAFCTRFILPGSYELIVKFSGGIVTVNHNLLMSIAVISFTNQNCDFITVPFFVWLYCRSTTTDKVDGLDLDVLR